MTAPPITCSLTGPERTARVAAFRRLTRTARRTDGALLTFSGDAGTEAQLRALVAAEAECCPFLRFDVRRTGAALVLEVTGPAEAAALLDELAHAGAGASSPGGNG
jgi:hypothetical protein